MGKVSEEIENKKEFHSSMGFIMDLENILNYLSENDSYMAQIGKTTIRYIGTSDKKQIFEIEKEVK